MTPIGGETGTRNSTLLVMLCSAVFCSGLSLKLFVGSSCFSFSDVSALTPTPPWFAWCAGKPYPRSSASKMPLSSTTAPWVQEGIDLQAIWMV
jgi:hypothetical protein